MLKWLTDWGWYCFAGGWRRVASRHRWSETKILVDGLDGCWFLADFGWFCIQVPRRCFWTTPSWLLAWTSIWLEITHGFNQIKHWLSLVVIDCHVSFVHLCPYFYIFVHVHPCSSLFQFANARVLWRCGWSSLCRLLSGSEVDDGQADGVVVVALWGGRPGRTTGSEADSRRSLGHRKSSREIPRTYREIEKSGRSR